jgi:hypothetical protein
MEIFIFMVEVADRLLMLVILVLGAIYKRKENIKSRQGYDFNTCYLFVFLTPPHFSLPIISKNLPANR